MKAIARKDIHYNLMLLSICLIVAGLPLSKFLVSIGGLGLALNWLAEANFRQKLSCLKSNRTAIILISLYLLHIIGLLWTNDFDYGLKDLRIKLPILLMPIVLGTVKPLSAKILKNILLLFVASVMLSTFVGTCIYLGLSNKQVVDIRDISPFVSHIRLSLFICLSVFILFYYMTQCRLSLIIKTIYLCCIVWMCFFLMLSESFTGIVILPVVTVIVLLVKGISRPKLLTKVVSSVLALILIGVSFFFANKLIYSEYVPNIKQNNELLQYTDNGNLYSHDLKDMQTENGYFLLRNVSWPEMKQAWEERSSVGFDSLDSKGQVIGYTLLRFLTSKGLPKDYAAVMLLKPEEVQAIESGITNELFLGKMNVFQRINYRYEKMLFAIEVYKKHADPSGYSLMQRFEYWKTAISIIAENPLLGVGTGDIANAYRNAYENNGSKLGENYRLRAHNQYLAIAVCFGIIGIIWFLIVLIYPFFTANSKHLLYLSFFLIIALSMLTEDTLETQAGVTFYAFFNSIFLFFNPIIQKVVPADSSNA